MELDCFMSIPQREPALVKEFRDLYDYVFELGKHITLVYKRLENIEIRLKEISVEFNESSTVNQSEIVDIREKMFTKSEFDDFVGGLKAQVEDTLPSLPESPLTNFETSELTSGQKTEPTQETEPPQETEHTQEIEPTSEEQPGGIFSWRRSSTSKDTG